MTHSAPLASALMLSMVSGGMIGELRASETSRAVGDRLQATFPGARIRDASDGSVRIYGSPMTSADTVEQAVAWWLEDNGDVFGIADSDLRFVRSNTVNRDGRFSVFAFEQYVDGLPVEGSTARILVRNGRPAAVVYAAARLAEPGPAAYFEDRISADGALASVESRDDFAQLTEWTAPAKVILTRDDSRAGEPIRVWKFRGARPEAAALESYTFFVSTFDGALIHVRNEVHRIDIVGNISGSATPGVLPDVDYNPAEMMGLEDIRVGVVDGNSTFTDVGGDYAIPHEDDAEVTVEADVIGQWVIVQNDAGPELHLEQTVLPPGPADFVFNEIPTNGATAQVNAHQVTTRVHNFYTDRQPDFEGIDVPITAIVNIPLSCGANYSGTTISFYTESALCPNTAYSTVIAHEYAHFIVAAHGLAQGSFGEGFADTVGHLVYDTPIVGHDFLGPGTFVRNTELENRQYPCSGSIFDCGMVLSGVFWDIKLNLESSMGPEGALEFTRQIFTDFAEITIGGSGNDSAHPETAIEVLTVDDDDGDVDNGTPHADEICAAFGKHNIDCPEFEEPCDGDTNGDGVVDPLDSGFVLARFGCPVNSGDPDCDAANANGDGVVDPLDVGYVLARFGECP